MMSKKSYISKQDLLRKMEHYCAYQERCNYEVTQKIAQYNVIPDLELLVITHLIEHNFLNEERFAISYVRGKFKNKHWGRHRLKIALKHKQISDYLIRKALLQINEEEYHILFYELANKKWENLKKYEHQKAKQKFIYYFQYRGWENDLVFGYLNECT